MTRRWRAAAGRRTRDWPLLYARGIARERSGDWARAEADFLRALELAPEQPYVLNYLGYTWAEQGKNLDRAKAMLLRATELRPQDGNIADSLGWVLFRLGDMPGAVTWLEKAVELESRNSVINDHLGDAYWAAGRQREARFQWRRALTLDPEPEELAKIEAKLRDGLPRRPPAPRSADAAPRRALDGARAGQGQPLPARHRAAGGWLPPAGQPGGLRPGGGPRWPRRRRRRCALRWTGRSARALASRGGQPRAARRAGAGGGRPGSPRRRGAAADQAPAGGLRHRRRLGGCGGGAAAAGPALGAGARRRRGWPRLGRGSAPTCRSASPPRPARMEGVGEVLSPAPALPRMRAAAGEPGRGAGDAGGVPGAGRRGFSPPAALPRRLGRRGRHGARPARRCATTWRRRRSRSARRWPRCWRRCAPCPGCLLARMSGSGATCFGLFADAAAARRRRRRLPRLAGGGAAGGLYGGRRPDALFTGPHGWGVAKR